ncbi:MAG: DUF2849 domain-containing protein [Azospirillaceae bacterium]|nr:DUF2849 domain-containing protein [Azospirillaceae bacterium]
MASKAITANRVQDGVTIWVGPDENWVERIADAAVFDDVSAETVLRAVKARGGTGFVVDPYVIEVTTNREGPFPVRYREQIRARGPSVRSDLGLAIDRRPA